MKPRCGPATLVLVGLVGLSGPGRAAPLRQDPSDRGSVPAPPAQPTRPRVETLTQPDGTSAIGRIVGDPRAGFRFVGDDGQPTGPLEPGSVISFDGPASDPTSGTAPIRVTLGLGQQLSGRLGQVDASSVRLEGGPSSAVVMVGRGGVLGLSQRPGEVVVFRDGFEALETGRWTEVGQPEIVAEPRQVGEHSLRIPAGGAAVTHRFSDPIPSGRLELLFHDDGRVVPGQRWFVDLMFRGAAGPELIRVLLDGGEESLAVHTRGGPTLPVQRLARRPGWRRLTARFGPETSDLAVDSDELAHGVGPGGPLVEIRLANEPTGPDLGGISAAVHFDDLRLIRLAEPVGPLEVDPTQDVVRLADHGDQLFGQFQTADADVIRFALEGRAITLPWTEVAGIDFRRVPTPGRPVDGLLIRATWRPNPGGDARDLDQVEGAIVALTDTSVTLATPYAGALTIPRGQLRQVEVQGRGRRVVLDTTPHHLGNTPSRKPPLLDPPLPEGGVLEVRFTLDAVPPDRSAALVVDAVQVVGEAASLPFSDLVRAGEIRTVATLNGQPFDYLNRHITTRNETPERIRLPIPAGLLRPGENRLRFEQAGMKSNPAELDDLGVLSVAVEFAEPSRPPNEKP